MKTKNNKQKNIYFMIVLFLTLVSCSGLKLSNTSTGTYKYISKLPYPNVLEVNVGIIPLTSVALQEEKPKTFWDLRDSIPNLYLKLLSSKIKDADTFINSISKPLSTVEKKDPKTQTDFRDIKVRFVFSNIKKYYENGRFMHPNTRLEFLNTFLEIKNKENAYFYSIDKLENEFEEIDLGTIERIQEVKLQANLSAETGFGTTSNNTIGYDKTSSNESDDGTGNTRSNTTNKSKKNTTTSEAKSGYKADASYANNESIKEVVNGKLKRLKMGFSFSSDKITIGQRGAANRDISDNVYVIATLRIKNSPETNIVDSKRITTLTNLYDMQNSFIKPDDIKIQHDDINYLMCSKLKNIEFMTSYSGAVRAVNNLPQDNSYLEFDDTVTYYKISDTTNNVALSLNKNDFCKNLYRLIACKVGNTNPNDYYTLRIINKKAGYEGDVFLTEDYKTSAFFSWIMDILNNPTGKNLKTSKFELYFEDLSRNRVPLAGEKVNSDAFKKIDFKSIKLDPVTNKN